MPGNAALAVPAERTDAATDLRLMLANSMKLLDASEAARKKAERRVTRLSRFALALARQRASLVVDLKISRTVIAARDDKIEELASENFDLEESVNELRDDKESLEATAGRLRDGLPDLVRARDTLKAGKSDHGRHELERFLDGLDIEWTTGGCNVGELLL